MKSSSPLELNKAIKNILEFSLEQSGADYCTFYNRSGSISLKKVFSSVPHDAQIKLRKKGYSVTSLITQKPNILSQKEVYPIHPEFEKIKTKNFALIPLILNKHVQGVMAFHSKKSNYFTKDKVLKLQENFQPLLISISLLNNYQEVLEQVKQRDLFMSILQHEIKNPLTSIQVYSHLIRKYLSENQLENSHLSSSLARETARLSQLASDLLGTPINKRNKIFDASQEICDLKEIIKQAKINIEHTYPKNTFISDDYATDKAFIKGNFNRYLQVLINLLSNAAKFSPVNKAIYIKLFEKETMYQIDIKDQGKGIPKKDIPKIFDKFFKGKGSPSGSMGIGLYLAKNIITSHKGHITVSSRLKKGTTFSIFLPK